MSTKNKIIKHKSLGSLRKAKKTKPRSPDMTGNFTLLKETFVEIARQYKAAGSGEVTCNIAAWRNREKTTGDAYLSLQITPWYLPPVKKGRKPDIFGELFEEHEEDSEERDEDDE
ncbi:MAG TPA: hypothetical protein VMU69_26885 [Bradyrhizobium sp.]|nr:hypothetical protein [Bradyrhizobium sp.]